MPQIINETNWGGQVGESLGNGIHEALNYLAVKKLNDLAEAKQLKGNEGALRVKGYNAEEARNLRHLKGTELAAALKTAPGRPATSEWINAQREAQGLPPLEGGSAFSQSMNALNQGAQPKQLMPANLQQQPNQKQQEAAAIFPQEQQQLLNAAKQFSNPLAIQEAKLARTGTPSRPKPQEIKEAAKAIDEAVNKNPQPAEPNLAAEAPIKNLTSLDKYSGMTRKEIEESIAKESERRRYEHGETKAYVKELNDRSKLAKDRLSEIDRLEENDKEGLISPGLNEFLKRSGFDIGALKNAPTEEFEKIIANQARNISKDFGGRVTEDQLRQFYRRWPDLSNSKEGRKRIYANLRLIERSELARKETQRDLYKKYGTNPLDIEDLVEENVGPKLDKIAAKFKEELAKPIPGEESSKLGTAAGALGGELARIAVPAATGALAGSIIPGVGTTAGGAAGALYGIGSPLIKQLLGALNRTE